MSKPDYEEAYRAERLRQTDEAITANKAEAKILAERRKLYAPFKGNAKPSDES